MTTVKILFGLSLAALLLVVVHFIIAENPNDKLNGFLRRTATSKLLATLKNIKSRQYRFANITDKRLVVIDINDGSIYTASRSLNLSEPMEVKFSTSIDRNDRIFLSDSCLKLVDYESQSCVSMNVRTGTISTESIMNPFIDAAPLFKNQMVLKFHDASGKIMIGKYQPSFGRMGNEVVLSTDRRDLIRMDGQLFIDYNAKRIAYVYFYLGRVLIMDSAMVAVEKFSTIDTVSSYRIEVFESERTGNIILKSPPVIVNDAAFLDDKYVYINSKLKADNQTDEWFKEYSVIDCYTVTGTYVGSIGLKKPWGTPLQRFVIRDQFIFAEYTKGIAVFEMNQSFFSQISH